MSFLVLKTEQTKQKKVSDLATAAKLLSYLHLLAFLLHVLLAQRVKVCNSKWQDVVTLGKS